MGFNLSHRSFVRTSALGAALVGSVSMAASIAVHPALAATVIAEFAKTFKCWRTMACITVSNTKAGAAIAATSVSGVGLVGSSLNSYGVTGSTSASGNKSGIAGYDYSAPESTTNAGVFGSSQKGLGVKGVSQGGPGGNFTSVSGIGLTASSISANGISGSTSSSTGTGSSGIAGYDNGNSQRNSGMSGFSIAGHGVSGFSDSGPGLYSQSNYIGMLTFSGGSTGVYASATGPSGAALQAVTANGVYNRVMVGTNSVTDQDVVSIDNAGNEILAGTLTASGTPSIRTSTSRGETVTAYSARSSSPTLEDFGETQLSNGQVYVALDATFATAIDQRAKYMVFLSPQGDNRGLYVTQISGSGFSVRESNSGRSNLTLDYRIVAKPYDTNKARFAPTTAFSGLVHGRALLSPPKQH